MTSQGHISNTLITSVNYFNNTTMFDNIILAIFGESKISRPESIPFAQANKTSELVLEIAS